MARRVPLGLVPAAARGVSRRQAEDESDLAGAAVDTFTQALGGRTAVAEALAIASDDPEIDRIYRLLLDPAYASYSLTKLCRLAGITPPELYQALGKATIAQAKVTAFVTEVAPKIRGVVKDVMERAQPYEIPCTACGGLGTLVPEPTKDVPNPVPGPCATCRGGGKLLALPDLDRQKLALELSGLISKGGGLAISVNQQQNNLNDTARSTQSGALEQLQQAVGEILYGQQPAAPESIDAEILSPAEPT